MSSSPPTSGLPAPEPGPRGPGPSHQVVLPAPGPAAPMQAHQGPAPGLDPVALLEAFRRRWPIALGAGLLCGAVAAAAVWHVVPPAKYVSKSTLMVKSYVPKLIFDTAEQQANVITFKQNQLAYIRSRLVLEDALRKEEVAGLACVRGREDPVEWIEKELKAGFDGASDILVISMTGDQREELPVLINAVVDSYEKLVVEKDQRERQERYADLKRLWERYQDKLKDQKEALRARVDEVGTSNQEALALKQQFAAENLSLAQNERRVVASEILRLESELEVFEARARSGAPGAPGSAPAAAAPPAPVGRSAAPADPRIAELQEQVAQLRSHIGSIKRRVVSSSDPSLTVPERQLAQALRELQQRQAQQLARAAAAPAAPGVAAAVGAGTHAQARDRLEVLRRVDEALAGQVEKFQQEARSLAGGTLDLSEEQDKLAHVDAAAKKIGGEIEALEVELGALPRVGRIDRAKPASGVRDNSKKLKLTGVAGLGSFAAMLAGITLLEYRARRVNSEQDVVCGLGIRLVGVLPVVPGRPPRRAGALEGPAPAGWENALIESVDSMRTMLLHASQAREVRVVMVTSALKGEGKSSLSSQLATSLARAGMRTLLVDCDLRRSALHKLFDAPNRPGLCDLLRGDVGLDDAAQPTMVENLELITAGDCDPLALRVLARGGARRVFDGLRDRYDYVVVDSAPVLPLADSLLLGQQVDAVVLSVLRDVSRLPQIHAAYQRLRDLDIQVLGAVVSGTTGLSYGYSGYQAYS